MRSVTPETVCDGRSRLGVVERDLKYGNDPQS